nr:SURF1 family protein [Auraticoccus cholistanensis]
MLTRLKQLAVLVVALAAAAGMVRLGWWQLDVYRQQAQGYALQRAAEPARPLTEVAPAGTLPEDGYGRTVTFAGRFVPEDQFLLPVPDAPGRYRVLTALKQADGSTVPVVRGVAELPGADPEPPAPPAGEQQLSGILLASEAAVDSPPLPPGQLASVRLPEVAQHWAPPLVNGVVTLDAAGAGAQGLQQAAVTLPEGEGELRNGGYAVQWWVFAAFGLLMAVFIVRDIGRRDAAGEPGAPESTGHPDGTGPRSTLGV